MTIKFPPAPIVLIIVFLSLIQLIGTVAAAAALGRWRVMGPESVSVFVLLTLTVLTIFPILAISGLYFRRPSGRYLALVPMLWLFGLSFKPFLELPFTRDIWSNQGLRGFWWLTGLSAVISASAIGTLAFSRTVRSYLNS